MSLADLLQWVDSIGKSGTLFIERSADPIWMRLKMRYIVEAGFPASRAIPVVTDVGITEMASVTLSPDVLALESLYDQFLDSDDQFRFVDEEVAAGSGIEVHVPIQEFVMQGLHFLDEWFRINQLYENDNARIHATDDTNVVGLTDIQRTVLAWARRDSTISSVRIGLGLSRPALLRRIEELRILGRITIDGTPAGDDLIAKLIGQATILLREQQYDEAAHVFSALLATDPSATKVKELYREAETKHVEALYQVLPPNAVVAVKDPNATNDKRLSRSDREVLDRINGRWDVSVLVLASPLREVETLKSLRTLLSLRLIELRVRVKKAATTQKKVVRTKKKSGQKAVVRKEGSKEPGKRKLLSPRSK